jgi:hypothetical protein
MGGSLTIADLGLGLAATAVCLSVIRIAVGANRSWPAFYRVFLLLFFTIWSAVLWLPAHRPDASMLLSALLLLAGAVAVGFVPLPPPKTRREAKNLLDLIETERSLNRFFNSGTGRVFWPMMSLLLFSVATRIAMLT